MPQKQAPKINTPKRSEELLPIPSQGASITAGKHKQMILRDRDGKEVKIWKNSSDLLRDVFLALKMFRDNEINEKAARIYLGLLRSGAVILSLNLDFARMTGQIRDGQKALNGFTIG